MAKEEGLLHQRLLLEKVPKGVWAQVKYDVALTASGVFYLRKKVVAEERFELD